MVHRVARCCQSVGATHLNWHLVLSAGSTFPSGRALVATPSCAADSTEFGSFGQPAFDRFGNLAKCFRFSGPTTRSDQLLPLKRLPWHVLAVPTPARGIFPSVSGFQASGACQAPMVLPLSSIRVVLAGFFNQVASFASSFLEPSNTAPRFIAPTIR